MERSTRAASGLLGRTRTAVVLANTQQRRNERLGVLNGLGYEAFAASTLDDVQAQGMGARRA